MKMYCERCEDFTHHDFRKFQPCERCRAFGSKTVVVLIQVGCILAFTAMVFHLAGWI